MSRKTVNSTAMKKRRTCSRKKMFQTQSKANKFAVSRNLYSYECPYCHSWHVTKLKPVSVDDAVTERVAWALCAHDLPCSSMVAETMDPKDPMFKLANADRLHGTGQTERDWYLEKAKRAINAFTEADNAN